MKYGLVTQLNYLKKQFKMTLEEVIQNTKTLLNKNIDVFKREKGSIYATSSFQTQSVPLLHLLSSYHKDIQVLFIDTGFLFPETYQFKNQLVEEFNLNLKTIRPSLSKHQQLDQSTGFFQYSLNPDKCCQINKVDPLDTFWKKNDVWISGVRRDQSSIRKQMKVIEESQNDVIKFHPMLEWNSKNVYDYIREFNLPKHPLEKKGFVSIGCVPCTHKWSNDEQRGGRWLGSKKTECGLHINK